MADFARASGSWSSTGKWRQSAIGGRSTSSPAIAARSLSTFFNPSDTRPPPATRSGACVFRAISNASGRAWGHSPQDLSRRTLRPGPRGRRCGPSGPRTGGDWTAACVVPAAPGPSLGYRRPIRSPGVSRGGGLDQQIRDFLRVLGYPYTGRLEGCDLVRRHPRTALDNRAPVAHPLSRRGGLAGDEGHDRLGHVAAVKLGGA